MTRVINLPSKKHILTTMAKILKEGFEGNHLHQFDVNTGSLNSAGVVIVIFGGVPAKKSVEKIKELMV